ncbi:MAG: hypothetical protein HDS16_05200 [Bacteroides sp.]|nr:hypothetical protein [Bacteroides sp.]
MEKFEILQNKDYECGEIRIGIYGEETGASCIFLGLNNYENKDQWGAQPLTPEMARHIGCLLIEYAAKAEEHQQNELKKICPF